MKLSGVFLIMMLVLAGGHALVFGQAAAPDMSGFNALITQINADISAGKHTESELAADIKQFDVLLAAQKGQPPVVSAYILMQKGIFYDKVLENPEKAQGIFQGILTNYPGNEVADRMPEAIKSLEPEVAKQKIRESLAPGKLFPDFNVTNMAGNPLSVAQYRGKVVLIDFWATWCPPCRRELPNVVAIYQKYHPQGFEIIGVTLDDDQTSVANFIKDSNMPWPEHFEGTGWDNTLVAKYGVSAIPDNILVDAQGHILGRGLKGDDLAQAVAKALAK